MNFKSSIKYGFLYIIIVLCVLFLFGCNGDSTIVGKYLDEKNSNNFTDLKADGTFLIRFGNQTINGKYLIDGNRLFLTRSTGEVAEGKIEGKTIIGNNGGRSTKK